MTAMPQHMQALASGDARRLAAAARRKEIRSYGFSRRSEAARRLAEAIADPDEALNTNRVSWLLKAVPGIGDSAARKCLVAAGVQGGDKRVRDLTVRQRNLIAAQLFLWAETRR
jgi:hypothetical protein